MRVKVKNTGGTQVIAHGPGKFRVKNKTGTQPIFLGIANYEHGQVGENVEPKPALTEAAGYEWPTAEGPLEVALGPDQCLLGIVKASEAEQEVHVLQTRATA